jgi:hypothetical protein
VVWRVGAKDERRVKVLALKDLDLRTTIDP